MVQHIRARCQSTAVLKGMKNVYYADALLSCLQRLRVPATLEGDPSSL